RRRKTSVERIALAHAPCGVVRETVLYEAERTSVQRPRRAVLYETVNMLLRPFAQRATPTLQRQGAPAAMARRPLLWPGARCYGQAPGCYGQTPGCYGQGARLLWPGAAAAVARRRGCCGQAPRLLWPGALWKGCQ